MCFHPAYPTTADLSREHNAALRDLEDLASLSTLHRILADAIARAGCVVPIQHPARTWSGAPELIEVLQGELLNVDATEQLIRRSPPVLED
jgi:hypothetical protein